MLTTTTLNLICKNNITINNTPPKKDKNISLTALSRKLANYTTLKPIITILNKHKLNTLESITNDYTLLSLQQIINKTTPRAITRTQWNAITTQLCTPETQKLKTQTIELGSNLSWLAKRLTDLKHALQLNPICTKCNIYTDGSFEQSENSAGSGVWASHAELSFKTAGKQTIYNAKLQAIIAAILTAPPNCNVTIHSDSQNSLDFINAAHEWTDIEWSCAPHFYTQKLLLYTLNHATNTFNNKYSFVKVAAHTNIEGNENADKLAKIGRNIIATIFNKLDLNNFHTHYNITLNDSNQENNYRELIKELNNNNLIEEIKTKNKITGFFPEFKYNINNTISNNYLLPTNKNIPNIRTIAKARQNKLR